KQGESRRPIYIECSDKGLLFHPDQKAMLPGVAPGEVRSEVLGRIAVQKRTLPAGADPRPYLLLLVRPAGIPAYYALQGALQDLAIDFGYEFIDNDWALDFPVDSPSLPTRPSLAGATTPP